jgi:hypothetical protein
VAFSLGQIRIGRLDLVVAVTCLGLLAGIAVPRHLDLAAATRRTEARAMAASIDSAARLANSVWYARGQPARLTLAGRQVSMVNGYPASADVAALLEPPEGSQFAFHDGAWQHRDVPAGRPCGVSYTPPAREGDAPAVRERLTDC